MRLVVICLGFFFITLTHSASAKNQVEKLLLGFYVNDVEIDSIDAIKNSSGIYIPLKVVIDNLGIKPVKTTDAWQFNSPIGDATISPSVVIAHENQQFIPLDTFKPLGVNAVYNQSLFAIKLYIPWDSKKSAAATKNTIEKKPLTESRTIDYYPSTFGLGGISINGGFFRQISNESSTKKNKSTHDYLSLQVGLTGYLSGGLWGANFLAKQSNHASTKDDFFTNDNSQPLDVENIYWTTSGESFAMRLGTNTSSYWLDSNDYTGVTVAYSSKDIKHHLEHADNDTSRLLKSNNYSSRRNIKGSGPAGGIAELRVNGRAVARVRIGLDKKYEFIGLNMNDDSSDYDVEVAIFEYSLSDPPIRIYKPSLFTRRANVSTNELLLEAGVGQSGDFFNADDDEKSQTVAHAYAEYGLTNNIALRAAVANDASNIGIRDENNLQGMAGINIGLPFNINVDIAYEDLTNKRKVDAYLNYSYDSQYIDVNYSYEYLLNEYKSTKTANNTERSDEQNLYVNIKPNDNISLGLYGTHKESDNQATEQYFTANLSAQLHDNVNVNINRDRYNDYRYNINWLIPQWRTQVAADWDNNNQTLNISKTFTDSFEAGASVGKWHDRDEFAYRAYANYQYNEKNKFYVGAERYGSQNSYDANWQYQHNNYSSISLGYRKNQSQLERVIESSNPIFNESDYFYLQFSIDLVNTKHEGIDYGSYRPSYYGTVVTNLDIDDANDIELDDSIQIKLDGQSVEAQKVAKNQYRIENVKPGVYELDLSTDNLPIEYQTDKLEKPTIKVAEAAPTIVDYKLEKTSGVSGMLSTEKPDVLIEVYQQNKKITETYTRAYGHYQIVGLPAGQYVLRTVGKADKTVILNDRFLFEENF